MADITSRENAYIKTVRKLLSDRGARRKEGAFVCEGSKLCAEALAFGAKLLYMLVSESHTELHINLSDMAKNRGCPVFILGEKLFSGLSDVETSQGIMLVCALGSAEMPVRLRGRHYLVLERVSDPGNVGTIFRTADALGMDGVFLTGACADMYNPKTVRATMGSIFRLPVWETDIETVEQLLREAGIPLYAAALGEGAEPVTEVCLDTAAVAIGNEASGLSDETIKRCTRKVLIPMRGHTQSLNASAAAAIFIWEMSKYGGGGERCPL